MRPSPRALGLIGIVATLATAFSFTLASQTVRNSGHVPDVVSLAVLNASFWFGWALLALPLARAGAATSRARSVPVVS